MPDPASGPRFCFECGAPLPPGAKFCPQCGTKTSAPTPESPAPEVITEPAVPPELREKYEQAQRELRGDRREVVILFADLSGFTALSERLDAEEVSHLMQGLLRELADVVYRYEGYVDKYIGDAIMALFGAPIAHENDAERAVLAALDMLEVTTRRNTEGPHRLSLRVGLNLGEVVAAHVGSEARHQYTVMGDTVNVASRLESAAALDSVLISHSVYERIGTRFETEEVEPLTVKGKSEPLRAHRVLRFRPSGKARALDASPFVGRDEELASLEGFLRRVAEGQAGTLVIEAEAGTGKTRLVHEALSRTSLPLTVLEVDFSQIELPGRQTVATELFRQLVGEKPDSEPMVERAGELLKEVADKHASGVEDLVRQLVPTGSEAVATDPGLARQNRWLAVMALLVAKARQAPLVLRLEDVHWADESDQEFLGLLLAGLSGLPAGVVITVRPDPGLEWLPADAERIRLENLKEDAVRSILGDLYETLRPSVRKELLRKSEGNPLYLEELARSIRESIEGVVVSVPGSVQGLLQSRIDRLPAPVRLLLQMASVLGTQFSAGLLARMYKLESQSMPFEPAFATLQREEFVDPPATGELSRFRHALVQEVAYGSLLVRVRKVLHESAARLGEEHYADRLETEAPFFARHYWEAGLLPEAAPHLWNAGHMAERNYELHAAERYLGRLAEVIEQHPTIFEDRDQQAGFISTYGIVLKERGRFDEAEQWFERLQALGEQEGREEWIVKTLFQRGAIAWFRRKLDDAESLFEQGLSWRSEEEREKANLHSGLGLVHYCRANTPAALEEHGHALRLRQQIDDRFGIVKSLMNIGIVLFDLKDDLGGAEEHFERALGLARQIGDRETQCHLLLNLGTVDLERGEYESALGRYGDVQEVADEIGFSMIRFISLRNQAACHVRVGRIQRALQALRTCLREGENVLDPTNRLAVRILLHEAHACAVDETGAAEWLQEARDLATAQEVKDLDDWLYLSEGRWAGANGDWLEAAEHFATAAEAAARIGKPTYARLAEAHRWRAMARANAPLTEAFPAEAHSWKSWTALFKYLWADGAAATGSLQEAAAALAEAGDLAARLGDISLERAAFERQAEVLHVLGNEPGEREASLRAARAMFALRRGLSEELRVTFDAHPRNAGLLALAHV